MFHWQSLTHQEPWSQLEWVEEQLCESWRSGTDVLGVRFSDCCCCSEAATEVILLVCCKNCLEILHGVHRLWCFSLFCWESAVSEKINGIICYEKKCGFFFLHEWNKMLHTTRVIRFKPNTVAMFSSCRPQLEVHNSWKQTVSLEQLAILQQDPGNVMWTSVQFKTYSLWHLL